MKLIRHGQPGTEKPGVIIDGKKFDVSSFVHDYDEAFFSNQLDLFPTLVEKNRDKLQPLPEGIRLGHPFARPSKIICIGLNYSDHAKESNLAVPAEPVVFFKSTTSLCGPYDNVIIPPKSKKTDWEVELAFVIKKRASYISEKNAMDYVAGYCLHNDISEREFQLERGGQWVKGKSCDTFAPAGPWLSTSDEIKDVHNLKLWLKVNGVVKQNGNTANMIFKIPFLVHYLTQFMTLLPGDVISTGTPAGVGLGQKPEPVYLNAGDVMELGIEGLGEQKQTTVAYKI
jgi:2,4-didehydro-3-deoxy-L-rhamnonate hydrolase